MGVSGLALGLVAFDCDACLLGLEQVHGDGIGIGHLYEFDALGVEPRDATLGACQSLGVVVITDHHDLQLSTDRLSVQAVEVDPQMPAPRDAVFEVDSWKVGEIAAFASVAAAADVVVEGVPALAFARGEEQAALAPGAGHQSPQVVTIPPLLDGVLFTLLEDALHALK